MNPLRKISTLYIILFSLLALLSSGTSAYAQESDPISLEAYREKLVAASALLTDPVDPSEAINQAERLLADVHAVRLPSGATVVPHSLLNNPPTQADDSADDAPADPALLAAAALQRIHFAIQQIDLSADDNTDARLGALESVFARSQFSQGETLWQRFTNWLYDLIDRFLPRGNNGVSPALGQLIAWTVAIVGGLGLIFLLSYWLQGLFGSFVKDTAKRQNDADGKGLPVTALQARQQASQYAQAGNYREAVRSLYLSSLLSMEESGVIRYDRSLTNREVLNQIHARAAADNETDSEAVEEHLRPVVETFDAVWYGVREPDAETFESYEQEIDGLATVVNNSNIVNNSNVVNRTNERTQNRASERNPAIRTRPE